MKEQKRSNQLPAQGSISCKPFPASKKIFVKGEMHDINVPMREITLTNTVGPEHPDYNHPVIVYDTSGPFTDENQSIDLH